METCAKLRKMTSIEVPMTAEKRIAVEVIKLQPVVFSCQSSSLTMLGEKMYFCVTLLAVVDYLECFVAVAAG